MNYPIGQQLSTIYTYVTDKQNWINNFDIAKATAQPYAEKLATVFNNGLTNYFGVKEPRFTPINATLLATSLSLVTLGALYYGIFGSKKTKTETLPTEAKNLEAVEPKDNPNLSDKTKHAEILLNCKIEDIKTYVQLGVDVNSSMPNGETVLTSLGIKSKVSPKAALARIEALKQCGVNLNLPNKIGMTPRQLCIPYSAAHKALSN